MDEGDLNELLLLEGPGLFRGVKGFRRSLWARRIGPGDRRDIDFLVVDPDDGNVAVIEAAVRMQGDLGQLKSYADWLSRSSSEEISLRVAQAVGLSEGTRARALANQKSSLRRWMGKNDVQGRERLQRLIRRRFGFLLLFLPIMHGRPRRLELLCEKDLPLNVRAKGGETVSTRFLAVAVK